MLRPSSLLVVVIAMAVLSLPATGQIRLDASVVEAMQSHLVASDDPRSGHEPLWLAARAAHGRVAPALAWLADRAERAGSAEERLQALRLLGTFQRRDGRLTEALASIRSIEASERSIVDHLFEAEVLDALGRTEQALSRYRELLTRSLDEAARNTILLRVALMQEEAVEALSSFSREEGRSKEEKNQAAVALALLGDQKTAIDVFAVEGESTIRFRREVRLAEWAIECKAYDAAQQFAWAALRHAKLRRDQRYALTLLASAYRQDGAVAELIERLAAMDEMTDDARQLWIRLLREEGRVDDALRLFREADEGTFSAPMRRQLLEICRETGREDVLVEAFESLIASDPETLEWRNGLSRHHLEKGQRDRAVAVWEDLEDATEPMRLIDAAFALLDVGLDDVAERLARMAADAEGFRLQGLLFVFRLHLNRGNLEDAEAALGELAGVAPRGAGIRAEIADGYERIGRPDLAVEVLEGLREAREGFLGTDLEMKYAILLSRIEREEAALEVWRNLWARLRNSPRGRFVEDRMMTVASRLGRLARIAIELEDRLASGDADDEDIDLLVRLYIKVGDPASATEILEEYMKREGEDDLEVLKRKSKIYLACQDYFNYERLVKELVERDQANRLDHLRELAMCQLERGRRDLAIALLPQIREASGDDVQIADEFEAGIYGIVGMKEEALLAYLRGMGRHPERIDTHLLISNLLRDTGEETRAVRMFQYMAQTAERDDLFTIAIDGILNLRAPRESTVPDEPVRWALRTTMERLAERPHRFYLYRLTADLAEDLGDMPLAIRSLKAGLPVAGERRTAIMREIMNKCRALDPQARQVYGATGFNPSDAWDASEYLMIGRRLLGQGDHVPPTIFMDLASALIREGDVPGAMRTFSRASEFLEYAEVTREAARVLEAAGHVESALSFQRRLLATAPDDATLVLKIANLEEELGRADRAFEMYARGIEIVCAGKARFVTHREESAGATNPLALFRGGNVDEDTATLDALVRGAIVSLGDRAEVEGFVTALQQSVVAEFVDLEAPSPELVLVDHPRLAARIGVWRRIALAHGMLAEAHAFERFIWERFPRDRGALRDAIDQRRKRGFVGAARELLAASPFAEDGELRAVAGAQDVLETESLRIAALAKRIVPLLGGPIEDLRALLGKVDTAVLGDADLEAVPAVLAACVMAGDRDTGGRVVRAALRHAKGEADPLDTLLEQIFGLAQRIDPDLARSVFVEQAENRITASPRNLYTIMELETRLGGDLIDDEVARRILLASAENADANLDYGATQLLSRVDPERRAAVIRQMHQAYPASKRAQLLTSAASYMEPPLDESFIDWFARTLASDLKNGDNMMVRMEVGRPAQTTTSPELMLAVARVVDENKPNVTNVTIQIESLASLGRFEEARELFLKHSGRFFSDDYSARMGRNQVAVALSMGSHRAAFVALLDELAAGPDASEELGAYRWDVLRGGSEYEQVLLAALAERPDDVALLGRLVRFHTEEEHLAEAASVLERLVALQPDSVPWKQQLQRMHRRLANPIAAGKLQAAQVPRPATRGAPGVPVAVAAPIVVSVAVGAPVAGGRAARPAVPGADIDELIAKGEMEAARLALRARWRAFRGGRSGPFAVGWPLNMMLVYSGGPVRPRPGVVTIFGSLKEKPAFVAEEAALALRAMAGETAPRVRAIRTELLESIVAGLGEEARETRLAALQAAVAAGVASSDDVELLLRLLATREEGTPDVAALAARPEFPDSGRLRILGSLLARAQEPDWAAAILRVAMLSAGDDPYGMARREPGGPLKRGIAELETILGDDARGFIVPMIDDYLATASSYEARNAVTVIVEAWKKHLSVEEAATRARALWSMISDVSSGSGRAHAPLVALLARGGFTEDALAVGKTFLCRTNDPFRMVQPGRRVRMHESMFAPFLAADGEWKARDTWLETLAEELLTWNEEGQLLASTTVLAAVAEALHELGRDELVARCVAAAVAAASGTRDRVTVARMQRVLGEAEEASTIEEELLAQRRLAPQEIAPVVERLIARDADAGLAAAERAAEYTLHRSLLDLLIRESRSAGREDRATHWSQVLEEAHPPAEEKEEAEAEKAGR